MCCFVLVLEYSGDKSVFECSFSIWSIISLKGNFSTVFISFIVSHQLFLDLSYNEIEYAKIVYTIIIALLNLILNAMIHFVIEYDSVKVVYNKKLSNYVNIFAYSWVIQYGMGSSSQLYSLSWGEFSSSLVSAVQLLRGHGDLVDVTLAAGGRSFPAHKIVLCAASPFLLDLLKVVSLFR